MIQKLWSKWRKALPFTALIPAIGLSFYLIYTFKFGYDISDEGYYYYFLKNGSSDLSVFSLWYQPLYYLGYLFGHSLLGFRIAGLLLLQGASYLLFKSVTSYINSSYKFSFQDNIMAFSFSALSSIIFYHQIPTPGYNWAIVFATTVSLTYLLKLLKSDILKKKHLVIFVLFSLYALLSKWTFGIILITNYLMTVIALRRFKLLKGVLLTASILSIIYMLLFSKALTLFINFNKFLLLTSKSTYGLKLLLRQYYSQFHDAFFMDLSNIHPNSIGLYILLTPLFLILFIIFLQIRKKEVNSVKQLSVLLYLTAITLLHPFGSNTNLISALLYAFSIPICVTMAISMQLLKRNTFNLLVLVITPVLSIFAFNIINQTQHHNQYRTAGFIYQTTSLKNDLGFRAIEIEKNYAQPISELDNLLKKLNFNYENDRIIAFTNMPGFLAASNAKAFGEPWIITGYENSIPRLIYNLKHSPPVKGHIYILTTHNHYPQEFINFFQAHLKTTNQTKIYPLPDFHHWRAGKKLSLRLSGPFAYIK